MTAYQDIRPAAGRRADVGTVLLSERDITGLVLCGDMYGAPYDLLAAALGVQQSLDHQAEGDGPEHGVARRAWRGGPGR